MELPPPDYTLALRAGIAGSPSPRSEKRPQQGHDGGRRYEDHQKRNHAHRDPENQKGHRAKHDRGHDHRDRSDEPRTHPLMTIALPPRSITIMQTSVLAGRPHRTERVCSRI